MRFPAFRACVALLALLDAAGAAAALDLSNASVETLDNGMTVILLEDRNFPVASVQMLYRIGARNESYGETGIAHFLEHMAYRDTGHFPDTGVVSSIYARGGEWHGYTWTDETTYFATVPREHLDLLLRIEADRLARLEIRADDIEAERGAVLAEMHMYENYPTSMLLDAVLYASFIAHPYRNNTIGWESDIAGLTHAEIADFYRRHYKPANAVLAVVGDFDADAVRARIHELFGELPAGEPTPLPRTVEPVQQGERRVRLHGATESKRLMIAWRAPSVNDPDYAAFLVLQEVLGAGSGVNFAQNDWGAAVDEDSLLYGAAGDLTTWFPPSADDYVFVIGGTAGAEADEGAVEKAISERLERVRAEPPDEAALADAIERVRNELVYDVETTEDAAHQLAFFAGLGALDVLLELPAQVGAVTAKDVQQAARRWLRPERRTIGWYVPGAAPRPATPVVGHGQSEIEMPPPAPLDETAVAAPVVKTLSGGIPAVVQPSDFSPSAYVQVVLAGTGFTGEDVQADDPVPGFSSLTRRFRRSELGSTLDGMRAAIDALRIERGADAGGAAGGDDPEARLEGAFDAVMSGPRGEPGSKAPVLVVVTGDVEATAAFAELDQRFGTLAPAPRIASAPRPFEPGDVDIALGRPVAQAQLGYIVPAPAPSDPDALAWRLLLYVLSHGYEGRLGKEAISNRGLAYYIDSRYHSDGKHGWITLAVGVDPPKLEPLRVLLSAELRRLHEQPPTESDLKEAKAYLLGRAVSAAQSNAELADVLARDMLWYGDVESPDELAARLRRVDRRDVLAAADAFGKGTVITVIAWGRNGREGESNVTN